MATQELHCDDHSQINLSAQAPFCPLTIVTSSLVSLPCFLCLACKERSMQYLSHCLLPSTGWRNYAQLPHEKALPI